MINPQWLVLPISKANFHSPKDVRALRFNCLSVTWPIVVLSVAFIILASDHHWALNLLCFITVFVIIYDSRWYFTDDVEKAMQTEHSFALGSCIRIKTDVQIMLYTTISNSFFFVFFFFFFFFFFVFSRQTERHVFIGGWIKAHSYYMSRVYVMITFWTFTNNNSFSLLVETVYKET